MLICAILLVGLLVLMVRHLMTDARRGKRWAGLR